MEYEEEENGVPGNTPEFGAIFMSNAETKRECFKRRVFALPSSMSGFVKQIKSGMVLFLFEFEKRKLYGVYKATCDGALNILPNVFRSGGKQFPSQVSFVPIWDCSPLSENEFRSAIRENYYSSKKFKFGLSEDQVRRLLQLFSTRRLNERSPVPERQHTRTLGQFSSGRGDQINYGRFCTREIVDTKHSKECLTRNIMNEYLENMEGRSTKIGDVRFCRDDRIQDEENFKSDGQRFLTHCADASLHKKRKISDGGLETNEPHASLHPFRTDSREASMHKERMPASSGKYLGAEDRDDGWNTFSSPFGTRYPELPFNLPNATDERHYPNGTNRIPIDDHRFLLNNSTTTESCLHNSHRPVSDEQEPRFFDRPGKIADDCEFLRNSEVGHNHHMDDGIAPVFPSESFGTPLHTVRGTSGHRLHFTNERVISEHGPDRGQMVSSSFSQKVLIPLDSHERNFDEQRYPRNSLVKSNFMDGHEGSATLNMSSGYDTRLERQNANDFLHHIGTLPRPVISTKSSSFHHPCRQSSLECYTKPSPDSKFPGYTMESQNLKASSSIFHDSAIVRSTLSDVPSAHHVRDVSFAAHQGARVAKEPLSHRSEVNIMGVPKGKSFEGEASNTYKASCFGNKVSSRDYNYSAYPTDDIYRDLHLKSPSPDYKSYQFSPANLHDLHSSEAGYFDNRDNTLSIDDNHELGQRLQKQIPRPVNDARKYICQQENDEVYAGNEHVFTYPNLSESDMYYSEKDPFSRQLDHSRGYRTRVIDDNSVGYYKSSEGPHPDRWKHSRTSVFARLTSGPKPRRRKQEDDAYFYDSPSIDAPKPRRRKPEDDAYFHDAPSSKPRRRKQEDDAYFYDAPSVDDVMEMLHQNQNVQVKNPRKFKSVARQQHDEEEEKEKNYKKISLEPQLEHDHPKIVSVEEVESETNPEIQQVIDDKPKETRMVEFKRRREVKKSLDEKTLENTPLRKEEGVSEENDKQKSTLGKQEKRRKLVRPNF